MLVAALVCLPMFLYGAPNGHSIEYNLVWLREFSAQLREGDLYPRWLIDMNRGAGSPVFFFYGSLPFYIASAGSALCESCRLVVQLALGEWLIVGFSGIAFFVFARARFGAAPAFVVALFYMVLPYHFEIDLWRRQAIGELASYIWMPLVLHCVDRLAAGQKAVGGLAFAYAFLLFSHLPTALLFSIGLGLYVLIYAWHGQWRDLLWRFALALGLGLLLASVYLVPALFAEQYINAKNLWTPYFDFHRWFFPGTASPDPHFTGRLWPVLELTTGLFVLAWSHAYLTARPRGNNSRQDDSNEAHARRPELPVDRADMNRGLLQAAGFALLAWFFMSPLSTLVWETAPFLWKVQFPWRMAVVLDLACALAALHSLRELFERRDVASVSVAAVLALLLGFCLFSGRDVVGNLDSLENKGYLAGRDAAVARGVDAPEYTTVWSKTFADDPKGEIAKMPRAEVVPAASGSVAVTQWEPRLIVLNVELKNAAAIEVRQFYFPGWRANYDEIVVDGDGADRKIPLTLGPSQPSGLLRIQAPAGRYSIMLNLEPLTQEWVGMALSGVGLFGVLLCARFLSVRRQIAVL